MYAKAFLEDLMVGAPIMKTSALSVASLAQFKNNFEKLIQQVKTWISEGFLVVISLEGIGILERYRDIFADGDIAVALVEKLSSDLSPDKLYLTSTVMRHGFIDQKLKIVFQFFMQVWK
mgnify:CR=1 FL=1